MPNPFIKDLQEALGMTGTAVDGRRGPMTNAAIHLAADQGRLRVVERQAVVPPAAAPVAGLTLPLQTVKQIYQGAARHPVREIIVHTAAVRPDWMKHSPLADKVAEIRRWHVSDRGWRDIGYHWIIDRDGRVMPGRKETEIGSHTIGRNLGSIGICLIGGHGSSERDRFLDNYTPEQDVALRQLIVSIAERAEVRKIAGHNEYAAKACPGFQVRPWWAGQ